MESLEFVWACGLFEGEGCFQNNSRYRRISLNTTDEDTIIRFCNAIGFGKVSGPYKPASKLSKKDKYEWRVTKWIEMKELIPRMLPYLCERRREAAQEILDNPPPGYYDHEGNYIRSLTHCKHGHEFTEENTYITKNAIRCKACKDINDANYREKKKLLV